MASKDVFSNDIVSIKKGMDDNVFTFSFKNEEEKRDLLIESLYKEIKISLKKREDDNVFDLDAGYIETLPSLIKRKLGVLSYELTLLCMLQLGEQCIYLNEKGVVYPFIDIHSIIVIDERYFILLSDEFIEYSREIDGNKIDIITPYQKTFIFSDEMLAIKTLPIKVFYNNWVQSLGLLGVYLISGKTKITHKTVIEYKSLIQDIEDTKLYFMLIRCLEKKSYKRKLLYI